MLDVCCRGFIAVFNGTKIQVAQLFQRDRAKLNTYSINFQRYSLNHAQNWIFGPPYGGIRDDMRFI